MRFSLILLRILFALCLAVICFIVGGTLGGLTVSKSEGLAGAAVVLWYSVFGAILGLVSGIIIPRYLSQQSLKRSSLYLGILALLVLGFMVYQYRQGPPTDPENLPQKVTPDEGSDALSLQTSFISSNSLYERPMGLGIAKPDMQLSQALYLYARPEFNQLPDMLAPTDSITFREQPGFIDIATAPPYLVPEALKLDCNTFFFRVISLSRYWAEVIVNNQHGQTAFIDRSRITYLSWPDFFLQVYGVERLDTESNPVRLKPSDQAGILASGPNISLQVLAVQGDWLEVSTHGLADRIPPTGYIRWRNANQLLVVYSLFS